MDNANLVELLRNAAGALDSLLCQMSQMQGMFSDEDGAIEAAIEAGEDSLAEIHHALREIKSHEQSA